MRTEGEREGKQVMNAMTFHELLAWFLTFTIKIKIKDYTRDQNEGIGRNLLSPGK